MGITQKSGEVIAGTEDGIIRTSTIRRRAGEADRWSKDELECMVGRPWSTIKGKRTIEIKSRIMPDIRDPVGESGVPKDGPEMPKYAHYPAIWSIRRKGAGYTDKCTGCESIKWGKTPVGHNKECRDRLRRDPRTRDRPAFVRERERFARYDEEKDYHERMKRKEEEELGGNSPEKGYPRPGLVGVGAAHGLVGGRGPAWPPGGAATRMGRYWGGSIALASPTA